MLKHLMIYLLVPLGAMLLLAGCGTTKKTQSSTTEIHSASEEQIYTTVEERSETTRQETTDKSVSVTEVTEREIIHTVYDTSQPMDPQTGEYPKQSETRTKERIQWKSFVEEQIKIKEAELNDLLREDAIHRKNKHQKSDRKNSLNMRKTKNLFWFWTFLLLSFLVFFILEVFSIKNTPCWRKQGGVRFIRYISFHG